MNDASERLESEIIFQSLHYAIHDVYFPTIIAQLFLLFIIHRKFIKQRPIILFIKLFFYSWVVVCSVALLVTLNCFSIFSILILLSLAFSFRSILHLLLLTEALIITLFMVALILGALLNTYAVINLSLIMLILGSLELSLGFLILA